MSLEWLDPQPPLVAIKGQIPYKSEYTIDTDFALMWAPDGDGMIMCGSAEELLKMLKDAIHQFESVVAFQTEDTSKSKSNELR